MYRIQVICSLLVFGSSHGATQSNYNTGLNPEQIIKKYGYPFEQHIVQTSDGYLLTLHRIPYGVKNNDSSRPAVLVMHGLLSSSADFVNMGPNKSIGFLLADAGYDVWLGNHRGNTWSRKHVAIDPDTANQKFYNFTLHELGTLDVSAKIDYILETTKQDSLFYVGQSQGTTILFILLSSRPEYNAKIKMAATLAPVAYLKHSKSPFVILLDSQYDFLKKFFSDAHIYEFLPFNLFLSKLLQLLLTNRLVQDIVVFSISVITGFNLSQLDKDFLPVIVSTSPTGASTQQCLQYLQFLQSGNFAQFDYGTEENLRIYGQSEPPKYDLSQITAPIMLHYSKNDLFVDVQDVQRLATELPNAQLKLVPSSFSHVDFLWAINAKELVYDDVISEMKSFRDK